MLRRPASAGRLEARTHMAAWAYMLRCADGSFYAGCTTDLDTRIGQHQAGEQAGYTARRRPVELVWAEEFQRVEDAIAAERRIKGWSRAKKDALIQGEWDVIRQLGSRARPQPLG
jgi:predicted GIY-YIG superfamily endonuclease